MEPPWYGGMVWYGMVPVCVGKGAEKKSQTWIPLEIEFYLTALLFSRHTTLVAPQSPPRTTTNLSTWAGIRNVSWKQGTNSFWTGRVGRTDSMGPIFVRTVAAKLECGTISIGFLTLLPIFSGW